MELVEVMLVPNFFFSLLVSAHFPSRHLPVHLDQLQKVLPRPVYFPRGTVPPSLPRVEMAWDSGNTDNVLWLPADHP